MFIVYDRASVVKARMRAGEAVDVVVVMRPELEDLLKDGKIANGSVVSVARSAIGVVVRAGGPKPDMSSADTLKRSLLAAQSIAYSDPARGTPSGVFFASLLERLGIAEQVRSKTTLAVSDRPIGERIAELVASGKAAIGIGQVSEMLPVPGVEFVVPLAEELRPNLVVAARISAGSRERDAANAFIRYLSSPAARKVIEANGMSPSVRSCRHEARLISRVGQFHMNTLAFQPDRSTRGVIITRILILAAICLPVVGFASLQAPIVVNEIAAERLRAHMAALADDVLEGRETGTRGFDRAAQYVAAQFKEIGLSPIEGTHLQRFRIKRSRVVEGGTSLVLTRSGRRDTLQYGRDFVTYGDALNGAVSVTGPVVPVGDGVSVPGTGVDAYAGRQVTGRIVIAIPGAPDSLTPGERAYFESSKAKADNAAEHGASVLLLVAEEHIPWELRVRAARQLGSSCWLPDRQGTRIPVVYIDRAVAARLLDDQSSTAPDSTVSAELRIRSDSREVQSANVYGVLKGGHDRLALEYVVMTAHLDHVGIGSAVDGDRIYNGAVDNASGVAGLLVMARAFATMEPRPHRSILFVATTGEEQGELGADYLIRHPPVPVNAMAAAINIDGLSFTTSTSLEAMGGANSSLGLLAQQAADRVGIRLTNQSAGVSGSDHAPFLLAGIPVLWIGAALSDDWMRTRYHSPKDDMSQPLDFGAASDYSRLVFAVTYLTAQAPERPSWNRGEFFQSFRR